MEVNEIFDFKNTPKELLDDKTFMLDAIKKDSKAIWHASSRLQYDENFCLEAVKQNVETIDYIGQFLDNPVFIFKVTKQSDKIFDNERFVRKAVNTFRKNLKKVAFPDSMLATADEKDFWNNFDNLVDHFVEATKNSNDLRNDRDFMEQLIWLEPSTFKYASNKIKEKEFCLNAINKDVTLFKYIPDNLKLDDDIFRKAITEKSNIQYVPEKLFSDKEFVIKAIHNGCDIYQHISKKLKNDKDIVWELIIKRDDIGYKLEQILPQKLRDDKVFMLGVVRNSGVSGFKLASERLQNDADVVLELIEKDVEHIKYAGPQIFDGGETEKKIKTNMENIVKNNLEYYFSGSSHQEKLKKGIELVENLFSEAKKNCLKNKEKKTQEFNKENNLGKSK